MERKSSFSKDLSVVSCLSLYQKMQVFYFFLWGDWGLNSGLPASPLSLELHLQSIFHSGYFGDGVQSLQDVKPLVMSVHL
jgi:hypothetical protein